jgi:hypothetical protein
MKRITAAIAIGFLIFIQPAHGIWFRSESVEWQTNVCDIVVVAEVVKTSEFELANEATKTNPSRQYWRSQTLRCTITKALKGRVGGSLTLRQNYYRKQNMPPTDDRPLQLGDKILIFAVEKPARGDDKVIFWVNLTKPDIVKAQHAPYNNDCKWLADGDSVLRTVQARVDLERKTEKAKQRGLILYFTAAPPEDVHWEFVRTADPEYKAELIKQLHNSIYSDDQQAAIYNLISYPGHETIKLILRFLRDRTVEQPVDPAHPPRQPAFPLRQAAYSALQFLGANPSKPDGFRADWRPRLMGTGFESRNYCPYGDWQRLED